ncbi:MAG: sporulation protein, partial [Cyanobacteriota bacterium]|nr:sporulation protein [Cyanobacteriota bacterium]
KSTLVRFEMLASKSAKPGAGVGFKRFEHSLGDRNSAGAGTVLMGSWRDGTTASVDANASFMGLTPPPPVPPLPLHSTRRSRHQPLMLLAMGQGFGHGVGMSQWGAHGLAQRGADFRQILNHYYRGAKIVPYRQLQNSSLVFLWRSRQPGGVERTGDA